MRGIKSNTCVDYSDPLTPTLSLWEREKYLSRKDRDLGEVTENFTDVWLNLFTSSQLPSRSSTGLTLFQCLQVGHCQWCVFARNPQWLHW